MGEFSTVPRRQVSTLWEPLAQLALTGTLVGSSGSGQGWSAHRNGSSSLPSGPPCWAAVELLTMLVPCFVAEDSATTQAVQGYLCLTAE